MLQSSCFIDDVYTYGGDMINFFFIFNMHKIFYCQKVGTNQVSFQLTIQPNTISFILLIVCLYLLLKMKHNRYALHIDFVE